MTERRGIGKEKEKDPYEVLGISPNVSQEEIKKAYRKLSLQHHPDRNNNSKESTEHFQMISQAYDLIGDEEKRRRYDVMGNMSMNNINMHNMNMPNIFSSFFPGGFAFSSADESSPGFFQASAEIDPAEILNFFSQNVFGHAQAANGHAQAANSHGPQGHGPQGHGPQGHGPQGHGPQGHGRNNIFNLDNIKASLAKATPIIKTEEITLSKAYTGGSIPLEITRWVLENDTRREETETVYVPIPKGVDQNEIIILREKGNVLRENNRGDVKVFIKVVNDTEFTRNGLDLVYQKKISLKEALCGFSFDMKHVDGRVFKINNGNGNVINNTYSKVLPGLGMKRDEHVGDLLINFTVEFPPKLSEVQVKSLLEIL
jgi:DnaJ-class molecular chaperone